MDLFIKLKVLTFREVRLIWVFKMLNAWAEPKKKRERNSINNNKAEETMRR